LPVLNAPQFAADGTLSLSGTGEPGATVELWAGEVKLGSVPVGADGTWSWAGEVDPGDYALTARTVDAAGQALNESASLALTVEVSTPAPGTAETVSPEESGEGEGYVVQPGDSLSALAARFYENGQLWRLIFDATNAKAAEDPTFQVIDNPNFIRPGWRLWIPAQ
jgi:nucleoid-associated protein YgaU